MTDSSQPQLNASPVGSMNYHALREIIEEFDILQLNRGAEVGVLNGDTSAHLLTSFPALTMFAIDPYLEYNEVENERTQNAMSVHHAVALEQLGQFGVRAALLKLNSRDGANEFPNGCLDFVFIDALHTHAAVQEDIAAWFPKIRQGGLIAGHDISWREVRRAVEEASCTYRLVMNYTPVASDIWYAFVLAEGEPEPIPRSERRRRLALETVATRHGIPIPSHLSVKPE